MRFTLDKFAIEIKDIKENSEWMEGKLSIYVDNFPVWKDVEWFVLWFWLEMEDTLLEMISSGKGMLCSLRGLFLPAIIFTPNGDNIHISSPQDNVSCSVNYRNLFHLLEQTISKVWKRDVYSGFKKNNHLENLTKIQKLYEEKIICLDSKSFSQLFNTLKTIHKDLLSISIKKNTKECTLNFTGNKTKQADDFPRDSITYKVIKEIENRIEELEFDVTITDDIDSVSMQ